MELVNIEVFLWGKGFFFIIVVWIGKTGWAREIY